MIFSPHGEAKGVGEQMTQDVKNLELVELGSRHLTTGVGLARLLEALRERNCSDLRSSSYSPDNSPQSLSEMLKYVEIYRFLQSPMECHVAIPARLAGGLVSNPCFAPNSFAGGR